MSFWLCTHIPKYLAKEADEYISQLPTYLDCVYGDEVIHVMTGEGTPKYQQSKWDDEKLRATSNLNIQLYIVAFKCVGSLCKWKKKKTVWTWC